MGQRAGHCVDLALAQTYGTCASKNEQKACHGMLFAHFCLDYDYYYNHDDDYYSSSLSCHIRLCSYT